MQRDDAPHTPWVGCIDCGQRITADRARWCPRCGAALATYATPTPHDTPAPRDATPGRGTRPFPRSLGRVGPAAVAAALVGVVVITSTSTPGGSGATSSGPNPLAPSAAVNDRDAIDPAHLEPDRVRPPPCAPDGCVRWQRSLDGEVVAAGHGRVLVLGDTALEGLDAGTGEPRWTADLADLVPAGDDGSPGRSLADPLAPAAVVPAEDGAVVVAPSAVAWITDDGRRAWTHRVRGFLARDAEVLADHVAVRTRSPRGSGPFGQLKVLDRATGELQWRREVAAVHGDRSVPIELPRHLASERVPADAPVLVSAAGARLEALEPADGAVRWSQPLGEPPAQVLRRGDVVELDGRDRRRVLRLVDGQPSRRDEGFPHSGPPRATSESAQVVLPDGTVWRSGDGGPIRLDRGRRTVTITDVGLQLLAVDPPVIGGPDRVAGVVFPGGG